MVVKKKKTQFQLDGSKTAMENLWEACSVAASDILRRLHLQNYKEERREIYEEMVLRGIESFLLNKVHFKTYDRKWSFFQNAYSSVWSISHTVIYRYIRDKKKSITALSTDLVDEEGNPMMWSLPEGDQHPLFYREYPYSKPIPILNNEERSRFGLVGAKLRAEPSRTFEALCTLEDEDNELMGHPTTADVEERRDEIRKRIDALPKSTSTQRYNREYQRKRRQRKK